MSNTGLPIAAYRDRLIETIAANRVTILVGETGSGKSSQTPQFLLDAGYEVVITQPRRIAARTLAERVAEERGVELGQEVGYMTANDRCVSDKTRCVFVTDGLQMVHELLNRRSTAGRVLCLDEVHEWNLNVEVLVAWAREQALSNPEFRVVLMSATLEAERLSEYFGGAPVVNVPGRTFPITTRPSSNKLEDDVQQLVSENRNVLVFQPGKAEIESTIFVLKNLGMNAEILPLHGELDSTEQKKCFKHYDRPKVVVSTNVAQTSITIDDIDAVVDSGMERRVELQGGVEGLYLKPISKSDSTQRAGRAGRTKAGIYIDHCGMGDAREAFPVAEIERVRLDQTVLRLAMVNFDMEKLTFFHQPDREEIHRAKQDLIKLGCMDDQFKVTPIGHKVARLPISVASGRMVIEAERLGVVKDVITIAAIMEIGQVNSRKLPDGSENYMWRYHIGGEESSDVVAQLNLYKTAEGMSRDEMLDAGIHVGAFYRIRESRRNLERALQRVISVTDSEGSRENILKAVCAGMINNLYRRKYGAYINETGIPREIGRESVVRATCDFIVALPFDLEIPTRFGKKTLRLVRMVSKVSLETLKEVAPHLFREVKSVNPSFSMLHYSVVSNTVTYFGDMEIESTEVLDPDHPQATELMVEYWYTFGDRPYMKELWIHDRGIKIPEVKEHVVGTHPETKERLKIYGTYSFDGRFSEYLSPVWFRSEQEAESTRTETLSALSAKHLGTRLSDFEGDMRTSKKSEVVAEKPANLQDKLLALQSKYAK